MTLESTPSQSAPRPEVGGAPPPAQTRLPFRWDLDLLRIVAILGVVAIHIIPLIQTDEGLRGSGSWNFSVAVQTVAIRCVPLFIMISGVLVLAPRMHVEGPWDFYRRRAARLLPAVIFWHLVYLFAIRVWLQGGELTAKGVAIDLIDARVYTALYFLWLILGLYLVAPVLASFLSQGGRARAIGTAVVAVGWASAVWSTAFVTGLLGDPRPFSVGMLTWWVFYVGTFVAGWAWREPRPTSRRWMWALPLALALMGMQVWQNLNLGEYRWLFALLPPGYISVSTTLSTVLFFVSVIDLCAKVKISERTARAIRVLGQATFGVFLFHMVVVAMIQEWMPEFYADSRPTAKLQMYVFVILVSFAVSVLASRIPFLRRLF